MSEVDQFFYRFRSARGLLEQFHELERQEIFFSPPEHLNDPMEGFRDVVWRGDAIAWKCHIKHYILCLMQTLSMFIISGRGDYDSVGENDFSFATSDRLPTPELYDTYERCCALFFSDEHAAGLPERLAAAKHPIRRAELVFFLSNMHSRALASIFTVFREKGLSSPISFPELAETMPLKKFSDEFFGGLDRLSAEDTSGEKLAEFFAVVGQIAPKSGMFHHDENRIGWARIVLDFPEQYVDRLNSLMYPDWYVSCFVKKPFACCDVGKLRGWPSRSVPEVQS